METERGRISNRLCTYADLFLKTDPTTLTSIAGFGYGQDLVKHTT